MKIYKVKTTTGKAEKTVLFAHFSKADEKWLDFVGADDETAMMTLPEQKEEYIRRTEVMLEPWGLKADNISKFEESNKCLSVGKVIENDLHTTEYLELVEPKEKQVGISNFIEWLNAHEIARTQFECHRDNVCGAWSIDAKEFCERYLLDYVGAEEQAFEQMTGDYDDYLATERAKLEKRIGDLTAEQKENLDETCRDEFGFGGQEEYLWFYILECLEKAPSLAKYYEEYKRESYEDYYV